MPDFYKLPLWSGKDIANVVVETPRGARVKLNYDAELGCFTMERALPAGIAYPYDWGFLPSTLSEDGDPLDVLIMHEESTVPGLVVRCRVAGALKVHETRPDGKRQRNDRFIAVPEEDCRARLSNVVELTKKLRTDLEEFFRTTGGTAGKTLRFLGWAEPKEALQLIKAGEKLFER